MEQASLSHILNAEGEKIQKIVAEGSTVNDVLSVNKSVEAIVKSITRLELVLQSKLELFEECVCEDCEKCDPVEIAISSSTGKAIEVSPKVYSIGVSPTISTTIQTTPISQITAASLDLGFTLVGNQLIAPSNLIPFQQYINILVINQGTPCEFKITINMIYASA